MSNIIQFPDRIKELSESKEIMDYLANAIEDDYLTTITVTIDGVKFDLEDGWQYTANDAIEDFRLSNLKSVLDQLYQNAKDHPDSIDLLTKQLEKISKSF